jgi:hypothetical protein
VEINDGVRDRMIAIKSGIYLSETACSECKGSRFAPTAVRYNKWNLSGLEFGRMGLSSDTYKRTSRKVFSDVLRRSKKITLLITTSFLTI